MSIPQRARLVTRKSRGTLVLEDPRTGSVHRLNPAAALIWQLCDGKRTADAIAAAVAGRYKIAPSQVASDVDATLEQFSRQGLVQAAGSSAERELIIACVRAALNLAEPESIGGALAGPIDWDYAVVTAGGHGVLPLFHRALARSPAAVPPPQRRWLSDAIEVIQRRNALLVRELLDLTKAFRTADVPMLSLKGPLLAVSAYGDPMLRQYSDLDLYVRPQHVAAARALLAARGYEFHLASDTDVLAFRQDGDTVIRVDLQWALAARRFRMPLTLDELWTRMQPLEFEGETLDEPCDSDHALLLAAHGAKHCWSRLQWIADFAAFARAAELTIDWEMALADARQRGGERLLLLAFHLAHETLNAPVPPAVASRIAQDDTVRSIAASLRARLFDPEDLGHFQGSFGFYEGGLLYLRMRERSRDRIPYALHMLRRPFKRLIALVSPTESDRAAVALPGRLSFLYYLMRPVILVRKHVPRLLQRDT